MARTLYAASPADSFVDASGAPIKNATAPVYTARTGGTQVTDLQTVSDSAITVVTADDDGTFRFYAEDGMLQTLWVEGAGGKRYKADPVNVNDRLIVVEAELAALTASIETQIADVLAGVDDAIAAAIAAHVAALDPHPQYTQLLDAATGEPYAGKQWAGGVFPTVALGAGEGDLLDFLG